MWRRLIVAMTFLCWLNSPTLASNDRERPDLPDQGTCPVLVAADTVADSHPEPQPDPALSSQSKAVADGAGQHADAKTPHTGDPPQSQVGAKGGEPVSGLKKWTSFGTGFVLGTPIAMVRRTISQDFVGAGQMPVIGKSKNRAKVWTARAVLLPACVVGGLVQGPVYSLEQSKKFSSTTPFSKDSFSLGHMAPDW